MRDILLVFVLVIAWIRALNNIDEDGTSLNRMSKQYDALSGERSDFTRHLTEITESYGFDEELDDEFDEEFDEWMNSLSYDELDFYYQLLLNDELDLESGSFESFGNGFDGYGTDNYMDFGENYHGYSRLLSQWSEVNDVYDAYDGPKRMNRQNAVRNARIPLKWPVIKIEYAKSKEISTTKYLKSVAQIGLAKTRNPKVPSLCSGVLVKTAPNSFRVLTNSKCIEKWHPFYRIKFGGNARKPCGVQSYKKYIYNNELNEGIAYLKLSDECNINDLKPYAWDDSTIRTSEYTGRKRLSVARYDTGFLRVSNFVNQRKEIYNYQFDPAQRGGPVYYVKKDGKPKIIGVLGVKEKKPIILYKKVEYKEGRQEPSWKTCVKAVDEQLKEFTPKTFFQKSVYKTLVHKKQLPFLTAKILASSVRIKIYKKNGKPYGDASGAVVKDKKGKRYVLTVAHNLYGKITKGNEVNNGKCTKYRDRQNVNRWKLRLHDPRGNVIICEVEEAMYPLDAEKRMPTFMYRTDLALIKLKENCINKGTNNVVKSKTLNAWDLMEISKGTTRIGQALSLQKLKKKFKRSKVYYAGYTVTDVTQIFQVSEIPSEITKPTLSPTDGAKCSQNMVLYKQKKSKYAQKIKECDEYDVYERRTKDVLFVPPFSRPGHSGGVFFYVENGVGKAVGVLSSGNGKRIYMIPTNTKILTMLLGQGNEKVTLKRSNANPPSNPPSIKKDRRMIDYFGKHCTKNEQGKFEIPDVPSKRNSQNIEGCG
eukprot:203790_1